MRFKPAVWYPIATILALVNLGAVAFAVQPGEPWWHATSHAGLAVAFGLWAQRLRGRRQRDALPAADQAEALEALEDTVGQLQRELAETQERLDFAERMLAQRLDAHRVEPPG